MDRTQEYLYRKLYGLFYKFCLTGIEAVKDDIVLMNDEVNTSADRTLKRIYDIVLEIIESKEGNYNQLWIEYQDIVSKEREDLWYISAIHALAYEYIFPNEKKKTKFQEQHQQCEHEINAERAQILPLTYNSTDYEINSHIAKKSVMQGEYEHRVGKRNFRIEQRSYLMVLKGFSSSTPFFYDALKERFQSNPIKGGGIFIKWKGNGIIIDPGINFVENMHLHDLNINDVHTVVITHNHIDHNGDLMVIDDLLAQMNLKNGKVGLYADKDTVSDHAESTLNKHFKIHKLSEQKSNIINLTDDKSVTAEYFETEHIMDETGDYRKEVSYGLKVTCEDDKGEKVCIGITSDTRYFEELSDELKDCNYVIANFSETNKEDYENGSAKENHLGYSGCLKLIRECNAKSALSNPIYIISEFWGGKGDIRREIVKKLRGDSRYKKIIPGDIGMTFMLDNDTFLCDFCGKETKIEEIRVIRQKGDYSRLSLVCNECVMDSK